MIETDGEAKNLLKEMKNSTKPHFLLFANNDCPYSRAFDSTWTKLTKNGDYNYAKLLGDGLVRVAEAIKYSDDIHTPTLLVFWKEGDSKFRWEEVPRGLNESAILEFAAKQLPQQTGASARVKWTYYVNLDRDGASQTHKNNVCLLRKLANELQHQVVLVRSSGPMRLEVTETRNMSGEEAARFIQEQYSTKCTGD